MLRKKDMAAKALRIIHIAKYFPPDPGGMEYFVRDLAYEQARIGHEVVVLAHAGQTSPGMVTPIERLTVQRHRVWFKAGRGYAPLAPGLLIKAGTLSGEFKSDLIHLHCPNPVGMVLRTPESAPLILHWHSDVIFPENRAPASWQVKLWRFFERHLLKRSTAIITTSPHYAETSQALRNYLDKVRVAPLGLPPEPKAPDKKHSGSASAWLASKPIGSRLLTIGRLSHYKGLSVLLEAMVDLRQAALCIIGEGEERARLEEMRSRLGLNDRIFFAGQVAESERECCLSLADVFCLPSLDRTEAFGLVLLEAMRVGKICLATSVLGSGMSYALDGGRAGVLVEPGRAEPLAEAIARLLGDPGLRSGLAKAGRDRFISNFTIGLVAERIDEIYRESLGHGL